MAIGSGFCPNCGTALTVAGQKFCATCGATLPAWTAPAAVPVPPPAPPVEAAPPPPPAWAAPLAASVPPPAPPVEAVPPPPPAWAVLPSASVPPPAPPVDYASPPPPAWGAPAGAYPPPPAPPGYQMPAPGQGGSAKSRTSPALLLLGLVLIAAVAGGAYLFMNNSKNSGAGSSSVPTVATSGGAGTPVVTTGPVATGPGESSSAGSGSALGGAADALSNITSYKFSMTLAGGEFDSMLSGLSGLTGAGASSGAPFTMSGTITESPSKAADITMAGIHMIEVGGFDYIDLSGSGTFIKTDASSSSLANSMSPASMFSSTMDTSPTSGWSKVGSGTKNGVAADHYQADSAALGDYGSSLGISGATWSADIWIAQTGGYPVSMSILATASDKTVAYEIKFDITNVNSSSNKITAPTNVIGS